MNALFEAHDSAFSSPKRKESKIDGVLMENGVGKQINGKTKTFRPATRSTKKINEYFAKLPANGLIRVQNGHGSHSEDSCDSIEDDHHEIKMGTTENVPPNGSGDHAIQKILTTTNNGPILKPEAQIANTNLFLQEPVMKLEFDKNEAAVMSSGIGPSTIKTSFLSTEITTKFQTLPPTEYINKVLNVNGSQESEAVSSSHEQNGFLLNSDSNSSDSGVVIVNGSVDSDGAVATNDNNLLKSPLPNNMRQKPTTPHRMILCPSPVKSAPSVHKQTAEIIKASRSKNRARTK